MFFTSYEFIAFFLVLFVLYYCVPKKCQWLLLLLASYVFYFIAGAEYLIYIIATTVTVYAAARLITDNEDRQKEYIKEKTELSREEKKIYKSGQKRIRRRYLIAAVLFNFGILLAVKYADFAIENVNDILRMAGAQERLSFLSLAVPMGISFYTLQAAGYLIDVYRGVYPAERNLFRFALFISFFPQLIQGPISRFADLSKTLYDRHPYSGRQVAFGLERMLWGLFKKMVIADRLLPGVGTIIGDTSAYSGAYIFAGMILYTVELYADFTGGIDITIGIAQTLGITVQENFRRPYFSTSLKEYWRRWHISMCSWFRDYVFYPVSISGGMQRVSKFTRRHFGERVGKRIPVYIASFLVWFATGLWHGASWCFIVWGLGNWLILMVSEELEPAYKRFHKRFAFANKAGYRVFACVRTFLLVCMLNLFDCYESLADCLRMIGSMFTAGNWQILWDGSLCEIGISVLDYAILACGVCLLFAVSLLQEKKSVRERIAARCYPVRFLLWYGLFLVVLLLGVYGIGYDASQFIYNRF